MEIKTKKGIAYGILVLFFAIGVICYAGYGKQAPYEPLRILFRSKAGGVFFDHKAHYLDYGFDCVSCHHEDPDYPMSCSECHGPDSYVPRADAFHMQCKGCHEDLEQGPVQCSECHVLQ